MEHLAVAKELAAHGVSLSTDHAELAATIWDSGCSVPRRAKRHLNPDARRFASVYIKGYCQPWVEFWEEALKPCGTSNSPVWCDFDTGIAYRLDLVGYLGAMISGLEAVGPGLEKVNIMDMIARTLSARTVAKNFPRLFLEPWAGKATTVYLKPASPDEAVTLAKTIRVYWFRAAFPVRQAFTDYLTDSRSISPSQRTVLEGLLADDPEP